MEITTDQLLTLIGSKEVEIYLLKQRLHGLEDTLRKVSQPPEEEKPPQPA